MGINEKYTIRFSTYENKLRKWWEQFDDDGTDDDLREKKRLILLLAHPTFKDDLNSCIHEIHKFTSGSKVNTKQFNLELRLPYPFSEVAQKWNISFSNGFLNYVIQLKCQKVEDFDFNVSKHVFAHDVFFNVRMLGSGFRSMNGLEVSRLLAAKSGGFSNSLFLEININSPEINAGMLWKIYQRNVKTMRSLDSKAGSVKGKLTSSQRSPQMKANQLLNLKRVKLNIENKFNEDYTGLRLSKKGNTKANRKNFDEVFSEICNLKLNMFERDLAIHYFKFDKVGNLSPIDLIFKDGEFHTKVGKSSKKLYEKYRYLYFFIDPLIAAPDFILKRSRTRQSKA